MDSFENHSWHYNSNTGINVLPWNKTWIYRCPVKENTGSFTTPSRNDTSGNSKRWSNQMDASRTSGLGNIIGPALEKEWTATYTCSISYCITCKSICRKFYGCNDYGIRNNGNYACSYGNKHVIQSSNVLCNMWWCNSIKSCK